MPDLIRPTLVDRTKYLRFCNKCRIENRTMKEVLEKFIVLYAKEGTSFFKK